MIITGGIDLSVGSMFALLGVIFIDLLVTFDVPGPLAVLIMIGARRRAWAPCMASSSRKLRMQPFVVTLCGLLIYRGIARFYTDDGTAGFAFGRASRRSSG